MSDKSDIKSVKEWITNNSWNLLVTAVAIIMAFSYNNFRIEVIAKQVETNTGIISKFPSQAWFDLKFQTIDEGQKRIEIQLKEHIGQ